MSSVVGILRLTPAPFGLLLMDSCLNSLKGVFFRLGLFRNGIGRLGRIIFGNDLGLLDEDVPVGLGNGIGSCGVGLRRLVENRYLAAACHPCLRTGYGLMGFAA